MFIDTLHPVHEGRLFRWGYDPTETPLLEYGRTSPDALAASGFNPRDVELAERFGDAVPSTGCSRLARLFLWPLNGSTEDEFSVLPDGAQKV